MMSAFPSIWAAPAFDLGTSLPLMGRVAALGRQAVAELGGVKLNRDNGVRDVTPPSVPPHRGEGGERAALFEEGHP